jgi:N-acetylneuraminic acid mutarotase/YHS domain-containing protein
MHYGVILPLLALLAAVSVRTDRYPPLPDAVSSFGATVCDGFVYVYGGHVGRSHEYSTQSVSGKFIRLDLSHPEKGWESLPAGPAIQGLALVSHGGKLYRIGGMQPRNEPGQKADNVSVAECAMFDPKSKQWKPLTDLPKGRSSHDATVVGNQIVVAGGWCMKGVGKESEWHDTALVLDLSKTPHRWEPIPQPFRRRALNLATVDDKAYVVCGLTRDGATELAINVLDPTTREWSDAPELPGSLMNGFNPAATALGGRLYVSPADGKLYRLAERQDRWEEVATLAKTRFVHRLVPASEQSLLVLGGASKMGNVAMTESINLVKGEVAKRKTPVREIPGNQEFCPILTKVPIGDDAVEVEYQGMKIKLCCATCVRKWRASPEAYLDARLLPQLGGMKIPKRTIEQRFCPVYPDRVVSEKDPSVEYQGTTIYVFNETAKKRFLADPQKYANPKVLPQLGMKR